MASELCCSSALALIGSLWGLLRVFGIFDKNSKNFDIMSAILSGD